ncbi:methyltransferase domain-containing protein [Desulfitobacterium dehalogenans]
MENSLEADVIICRHVIEHISDPIVLLKSIRKALGKG